MNKWLKRALCIAIAAMMPISLASCSNSETPGSTTSSGSSEQQNSQTGSDVTLTVGLPSGWLTYGDTDKLLEEYEKTTGIKVEVQAVEDDQFDNLLMAKMATNECWDVFQRYTGTQAMKYTNVEDLSNEAWVDRLQDSAKPYLTRDGKIVCAPTGGFTTLNILYNKTLFNELNLEVPETREEFESVCDTLLENDVIPIFMGSASGAGWMAVQLVNSSWSNIEAANDADVMDKLNANEITWSQVKTFPETLKMWEDWSKKGYFNPNMASDDTATGVKMVGEGECGMIITGDWQWAEFNEKYPDVEIGGMVPPAVEGENYLPMNGPNGMYVSSTSANVEEAKKLVAWLCEPEQLERYYEAKPDMSAWKDVESKNMNPVLSELSVYLDEGRSGTHWGQFYMVPYAEDMSSMIFQMISGQKTAEETLADWDDYMVKQGKQLGLAGF